MERNCTIDTCIICGQDYIVKEAPYCEIEILETDNPFNMCNDCFRKLKKTIVSCKDE